MVAINGQPLVELAPITDVYIDGVDHVEIIGGIYRVIYFKWVRLEGVWRRAAVDHATVRPLCGSGIFDPRTWGVPVAELNGKPPPNEIRTRQDRAHH